ncbi:MAG TPA: hypothetical protein VF943_07035 [Burkholderiales bacterium]
MEFSKTCNFLTALGLAAWLGGCATPMTEAECRAADWYKLGDIDARYYGIQPQLDRYAMQCGNFNIRPSESAYMAGWRDGYSETQGRMGSGGGGGGGGSM